MNPQADNLIWIDLEMTGLCPNQNRIIEIATVITDSHLRIVAEGPVLAIYQAEETMSTMDKWNIKTHTGSGLIERVRNSKLNETAAEEATLEFVMQHVPPGKSPMCGNSICQDRRFLYHYMPALEKYFHYRNLDVSTVKELTRRWLPEVAKAFKKDSKHQALNDIRDSIEELRYYRQHVFKIDFNEKVRA